MSGFAKLILKSRTLSASYRGGTWLRQKTQPHVKEANQLLVCSLGWYLQGGAGCVKTVSGTCLRPQDARDLPPDDDGVRLGEQADERCGLDERDDLGLVGRGVLLGAPLGHPRFQVAGGGPTVLG